MASETTTGSWTFAAEPDEGGIARMALSVVLGTGFTLGLFLGIAYYERGAPASPPPEVEDLHVTAMPVAPPPVPVTPPEPQPDVTPLPGFDFAPTDSPVSMAVSPPDLDKLLPEDMSRIPPVARIGPVAPKAKVALDYLSDPQHIYQKSEVDKIPTVLERHNPQISRDVRNDAAALRVTIIVVINADGSIGSARLATSSGNPDFDQLMVDNVKEWIFSPAIKGGKNVRCLVEQGIFVKWSGGSHFSL